MKKKVFMFIGLVLLLLIFTPSFSMAYTGVWYTKIVNEDTGDGGYRPNVIAYQLGYRTTNNAMYLRVGGDDLWYSTFRIYYQYGGGTSGPYTEVQVPSDGSYVETLLASGLQPNRSYSGLFYFYRDRWGYNGQYTYYYQFYTFITDPVGPSNPTYTNIKGNQVTVNWTKGSNYSDPPNYRLYRSTSPTGPWTEVYYGPMTTVSVSGLLAETTYYFYVQAIGLNGTTADSGVTSVITGEDPIVAAVNAAKGAAESSMDASEQAKIAAQQTYANTESIINILNQWDNRINAIESNITNIQSQISSVSADNMPPDLILDTISSARVTRGTGITLLISVVDNISTSFKYSINGGTWADLPTNGQVPVTLLSGLNTFVVGVKDEAGNVSQKVIRIWRL
jgi:hypothetical protein